MKNPKSKSELRNSAAEGAIAGATEKKAESVAAAAGEVVSPTTPGGEAVVPKPADPIGDATKSAVAPTATDPLPRVDATRAPSSAAAPVHPTTTMTGGEALYVPEAEALQPGPAAAPAKPSDAVAVPPELAPHPATTDAVSGLGIEDPRIPVEMVGRDPALAAVADPYAPIGDAVRRDDAPERSASAPLVRIRAVRDGFRRAGIAHSQAPRDYPVERFSRDDLEALRAEPMLSVALVAPGGQELAAWPDLIF